MIAQIHPLGAAIALFFVVSLFSILWWMLHPPLYIPAAAAKARRSVFAVKKILVPTVGLPYAERGVELACRLGSEQGAEILLTYVVEVPRTMPLGIPLPEAEQEGNEALERASSIVKLHGLPSQKILQRARLAGEEIARIARERDIDMIILGIRSDPGLKGELLGRTSDIILRHSPCEVVIDKLPKES
ncbi:MAG: universal stress protein [Nitrospirae bacterium]|nr:universal stress protein [Candidatus Manganitrophaceae bacterium]